MGHRVVEEWLGRRVPTLADLLGPGLRAVCIGINPSCVSVAKGHYFQGPTGQRFLAALAQAGLLPDGPSFEDDRAWANGIASPTWSSGRPRARAS